MLQNVCFSTLTNECIMLWVHSGMSLGKKAPMAVHLASVGVVWVHIKPRAFWASKWTLSLSSKQFLIAMKLGNVNGISDCLNMEIRTLKMKIKCCIADCVLLRKMIEILPKNYTEGLILHKVKKHVKDVKALHFLSHWCALKCYLVVKKWGN